MKRLLCVDGGGIRGLIPAILLAELEAKTGKACRDQFDMLAGTSTGGIIAIGLLAGIPASKLVDLYADRGCEIFSDAGLGVVRPKYSAAPLETILQELLGEIWLSETKGPELLACSFCADPYGAYFFKSWKARGSNLNPGDIQDDLDFRLWQIARATSAAETYFPTAEIQAMSGKTYYMLDGGTHSNNPTMAAVASASALWGLEPLRVLSLGTGRKPEALNGKASQGYGAIEWITEGDLIGGPCMDGVADAVDYQAASLKGRGVDVDRYQPNLPQEAAKMDDASPENITRLRAVAAAVSLDPSWTGS